MSRFPCAGLYRNGVVSGMTMSKALGPPAGPVNALEILIPPLNTTVSFDPTLLANVALNPPTVARVAERLICKLEILVEKGPPSRALGRYRSSRITSTLLHGNSADEYTFCNRIAWSKT